MEVQFWTSFKKISYIINDTSKISDLANWPFHIHWIVQIILYWLFIHLIVLLYLLIIPILSVLPFLQNNANNYVYCHGSDLRNSLQEQIVKNVL